MALRDHFRHQWDQKPAEGAVASSRADEWALVYLSVIRMQAISEAFDDDASGFVTVSEVNAFTTSRPLGWRYAFHLLLTVHMFIVVGISLPHWIAYWAIGKASHPTD